MFADHSAMTKTKWAVVALFLLCCAAVWWGHGWEERAWAAETEALRAPRHAESSSGSQVAPAQPEGGYTLLDDGPPACDSASIPPAAASYCRAKSRRELAGTIQGVSVAALIGSGLVVALWIVAPLAWRFFLRRLAEVSRAVRGERP